MSNIKIKEPRIIKNVFTIEEHTNLKNFLQEYSKKNMEYSPALGRYLLVHPIIDEYAQKLIPTAKILFESENILSSYSLFSHYEGAEANLFRHIDDNACTYTIDFCVYQNEPWAIGISYNGEDKEYILQENEAVVYYGNDQEHWRPKFPNPDSQHVAMIFFHFVEPNHWYHTKGPDYLDVVRKLITEDQWHERHK